MTGDWHDLARIGLIALMAALGALVLRLGIRRHQGTQQLMLPWWGATGWLAFIGVSATGQATRLHEGTLSWRWWALLGGTVVSLAAVLRVIRRRPGQPDQSAEPVTSGLPTTRLGWAQLALWVVLPAVLAWSFVSFTDALERQRCRDSVQSRGEIRGAVSVAVDEVVVRTQDSDTRNALAALPAQVDHRVQQVFPPIPPCVDRLGLDVEAPTLPEVLRENGVTTSTTERPERPEPSTPTS